MQTIYIRNMVCDRCVMVVTGLLREAGVEPLRVELGKATLPRELSQEEFASLERSLRAVGFAVVENPRRQLAEMVKGAVIELVHKENGSLRTNLSGYLSSRLGRDYDHISRVFSEEEGVTVESYFISQKIERVKELLSYGERSLAEIADMMNYSSAAHLSAQFRRVTGTTPTAFRREAWKRRPLDKI